MRTSRLSPKDVFIALRSIVVRIADDTNLNPESLEPSSSLVEDIKLDSLRFVDLTVAIEEEFSIDEIPMQEWVDEEAVQEGQRYTLGSLAARVFRIIDDSEA